MIPVNPYYIVRVCKLKTLIRVVLILMKRKSVIIIWTLLSIYRIVLALTAADYI